MAVKRKKQKKQQSAESWAKAVKIKCCHCDLAAECQFRERKERDENKGIITWCTLSPNKRKKKAKKKKEVAHKKYK